MSVRHLWATTGILLGALIALGFLTEFGRPSRVLFEGQVALPGEPASARADAAATAIGPFLLSGPTTLRLEQMQDTASAVVRTHVALIHEETGDVRETDLTTRGGRPSSRSDGALVDAIPSGTYLLRFDTDWEGPAGSRPGPPSRTHAQPPTIQVRAVAGVTTPWAFSLAALALLVPPAFVTFRRWQGRVPGRASNRSAEAPAT